jgi:hypothetical protein
MRGKITIGCILTCVLVGCVSLLSAQTEKGKMIIGGNADISESIQSTTTTFNFSLAPSFGAFLVNNFAIGGVYSFTTGSSSVLNSNDTRTTTTTFTTLVGPFLKYYIGKKAMKPFISANGGYSVYTRIRSTSGSTSSSLTNYDGFSTGGSVGIAYFLNPHLSLESALYLQASGYQTQIPSQRFGFSLGLYAFLDKKKPE